MIKVLVIIDLQKYFKGFLRQASVLKGVAALVKQGGYDHVINLTYVDSGELFPEIAEALKLSPAPVIHAEKNSNSGARQIFEALQNNGVDVTDALEFDVVGINTPFCVYDTVAQLVYKIDDFTGNKIRVIRKLVSHQSYQCKHLAPAIRHMKQLGIEIV